MAQVRPWRPTFSALTVRGHSLDADSSCERCGSQLFTIDISLHTRVTPLSLCARSGCTWYGVPQRTRAKVLAGTRRQKKPAQDPELRIRNYNEVSYGYDAELATLEAGRCLQCKKPDCVAGLPGRGRHPRVRQAADGG